VHWYRNIFSHVPSTKVREIAAMLFAMRASARSFFDSTPALPDTART